MFSFKSALWSAKQFQGAKTTDMLLHIIYKKPVLPSDELSLLVAIKHMLKSDYKNSCVMASVDKMLTLKMDKRPRTSGFRPAPPKYWTVNSDNYKPPIMEPDYPFVLLGDHGWQHMHPFIPIETANYTPGELDVMIDYYTDKRLVFSVAVLPLNLHHGNCSCNLYLYYMAE